MTATLNDKLIRMELDEFSRSGWMDYVVSAKGWWNTPDGVLKEVRRSSAPAAFYQTRRVLASALHRSPVLYRTLLLAEGFVISPLLEGFHDFGRYWTNDLIVANNYIPRRCYQTTYGMPESGVRHVVRIDAVTDADIDWIGTVGCHLTNPGLSEFRLKQGTLKSATSISEAWRDDGGRLVRSTPPVHGILPVAEGPGFLENFANLIAAERDRK